MCYKSPGPRCSSHAFKVLRDKHERLKDATAHCRNLEKRMASQQSIATRLGAVPEGNEDIILQNEYQEAVNAELQARAKYYTARDTFDETPAGQKRLSAHVEEFSESNPALATDCLRRQSKGLERRAQKFELYKQVNGLQGQDIDENDDTHDDGDPQIRLARTLGGAVTEETVRHAIDTRGAAPVYYRGSMAECHGPGEIMEMSGGRFTVRLGTGDVLEKVRGDSLVLT